MPYPLVATTTIQLAIDSPATTLPLIILPISLIVSSAKLKIGTSLLEVALKGDMEGQAVVTPIGYANLPYGLPSGINGVLSWDGKLLGSTEAIK